jgi:hypothetical protein
MPTSSETRCALAVQIVLYRERTQPRTTALLTALGELEAVARRRAVQCCAFIDIGLRGTSAALGASRSQRTKDTTMKTTSLETIDSDNLNAVTGGAHALSRQPAPPPPPAPSDVVGFDRQGDPFTTLPPVGTDVW